jgi:hypothetical protein
MKEFFEQVGNGYLLLSLALHGSTSAAVAHFVVQRKQVRSGQNSVPYCDALSAVSGPTQHIG